GRADRGGGPVLLRRSVPGLPTARDADEPARTRSAKRVHPAARRGDSSRGAGARAWMRNRATEPLPGNGRSDGARGGPDQGVPGAGGRGGEAFRSGGGAVRGNRPP